MEVRIRGITRRKHAPLEEDAAVRKALGPLGVESQLPFLGHGLPTQSLAAVQVVAQRILREGLSALGEDGATGQSARAVRHPTGIDFPATSEVIDSRRLQLNARRFDLSRAVEGHLLLARGTRCCP